MRNPGEKYVILVLKVDAKFPEFGGKLLEIMSQYVIPGLRTAKNSIQAMYCNF